MKLIRENFGDHPGLITSSWTPIGLSTHGPFAWGKLIFEDPNIIVNGGAEIARPDGEPLGWRKRTRNCEVRITRTTEDKTDEVASAKIHLKGTGGNFGVRCGRAMIPRKPVDTTYLFTVDVKAEVSKGTKFVGCFRVGTGDNLQVGRFRYDSGWQRVRVPITVLADQPFGMLDLVGAVNGEAILFVDMSGLRSWSLQNSTTLPMRSA